MAVDNAQLPVLNNGVGSTEKTERKDTWWAQPLATFIVFTAFIIYATWRLLENAYYDTFDPTTMSYVGSQFHLLSPFYSPTLFYGFTLGSFHISPALWILPFPLLFRGTCYYYRKAYYRAYFWDPPACGVGEPFARKHYTGEREFPLTIQNFHRYAFYFAVIVLAVLWWDALDAFRYTTPDGLVRVGVSVGSLVFLVNVVLLTLYTFSCHCWRHLIGGNIDCFSASGGNKARHTIWERISHLNENHALWAWLSLFSVAITDLYVRYVVIGALPDLRLIG